VPNQRDSQKLACDDILVCTLPLSRLLRNSPLPLSRLGIRLTGSALLIRLKGSAVSHSALPLSRLLRNSPLPLSQLLRNSPLPLSRLGIRLKGSAVLIRLKGTFEPTFDSAQR